MNNARESEMQRLLRLVKQARSHELKRKLWRKYADLHAQRDQAFVEKLEREQGIYRG